MLYPRYKSHTVFTLCSPLCRVHVLQVLPAGLDTNIQNFLDLLAVPTSYTKVWRALLLRKAKHTVTCYFTPVLSISFCWVCDG